MYAAEIFALSTLSSSRMGTKSRSGIKAMSWTSRLESTLDEALLVACARRMKSSRAKSVLLSYQSSRPVVYRLTIRSVLELEPTRSAVLAGERLAGSVEVKSPVCGVARAILTGIIVSSIIRIFRRTQPFACVKSRSTAVFPRGCYSCDSDYHGVTGRLIRQWR